MFERIVVGTDGSPGALEAIRTAGELARLGGIGTVHVVTASDPIPARELERLRGELPDEFHGVFDGHLPQHERFDEARSILAPFGVAPVEHDLAADPTSAIIDTAESVHADLIVVGARGLGAVGRFLRGSVSTKVAHHAPCAVLIVDHSER